MSPDRIDFGGRVFSWTADSFGCEPGAKCTRQVLKFVAEVFDIDEAIVDREGANVWRSVKFFEPSFIQKLVVSIDERKKVFVGGHVVVKIDIELFLALQSGGEDL